MDEEERYSYLSEIDGLGYTLDEQDAEIKALKKEASDDRWTIETLKRRVRMLELDTRPYHP